MIKLTIMIDVNDDNIIGVKESVANDLEKYGDVKSVYVNEVSDSEDNPVKHGWWVKQLGDTHWCSECGRDATFTRDKKEVCGVACTFCGAKMEEGEA